LESREQFKIYYAKNIIFAAGGNPGMYRNTVYPLSQFGSSGIMAREGVRFSNMTEWQYGIASVKFRWNLSGSYQQVIPRYIALDEKGNEEEFLHSYFSSVKNLGRAVFLKGYQWPFDPGKIAGEASSLVDLAIYIEKHIKGRRIFMDFTHNTGGKPFVIEEIDETAREYLEKSNALGPSPLDRLLSLNPLAYELYKSHGIDLAKEYLEIDVVPQHHNGGAEVNIWWETSVKHLFALGECAGTHGVQRPGGSALNAGQVGGYRAAAYIAGHYLKDDGYFSPTALDKMAAEEIKEFEEEFKSAPTPAPDESASAPTSQPGTGQQTQPGGAPLLERLQELNTGTAAFIRPKEEIEASLKTLEVLARQRPALPENLTDLFALKEIILMSRLMYSAILAYIKGGGKSRGSYLIIDSVKNIRDCLAGLETDTRFRDKVINSWYEKNEDRVVSAIRQVRPIPESDTWFEKVWREYLDGEIFRV
jgi:succinate dehydrogenase/fumarate reductase flavoprotein subunit